VSMASCVKKRDGDGSGGWRVLATAGCGMLLLLHGVALAPSTLLFGRCVSSHHSHASLVFFSPVLDGPARCLCLTRSSATIQAQADAVLGGLAKGRCARN
jgi:hypothetical protein